MRCESRSLRLRRNLTTRDILIGFWKNVGDTSINAGFDGICIHGSGMKAWAMLGLNNNLPPSERFKHENIMMLGIWFCAEKPNSEYMFEMLVQDLDDAVDLFFLPDATGKQIPCRVRTLAIILDLEALWMATRMIPNGPYPCGHCEQASGTTPNPNPKKKAKRYLPLTTDPPQQQPGAKGATSAHFHPKYRTLGDWAFCCENAGDENKAKGIQGYCVLMTLRYFRFPEAVIPDPMHFVYLHLVPEFRSMWFAPKYLVRDLVFPTSRPFLTSNMHILRRALSFQSTTSMMR